MNIIAKELNEVIEKSNPFIMEMLSVIGKNIFFPKGILSQSAEAKVKAHKLNATIGIATEKGRTMHLDSVMSAFNDLEPEESLTYAPSFGIPGLRKKWREELFEKNSSIGKTPISLPVVTCGITHGISVFADLWIDPDDVIISPDMMWGNYNLILDIRKHARIKKFPIFTENGRFNTAAFEDRVKKEAADNDKITVLLNFPHNPTGYTLTEEEGNSIVKILSETAQKGTNVIAVCDDAYFGLFYEKEAMQESLFARLCSLHPRLLAVKLDGATKENFVWGLRVGFITYGCLCGSDPAIFFDALEKKTAGCVRGSISNASHLSQTIILRSMQNKNYHVEKKEKFDILNSRAKRVKEVLSDSKYNEAWDVYPFNSGYFMCIKLKTVNAEDLRVHLLDKYGVGLIAIDDYNLRVAFSSLEEKDTKALFDIVLSDDDPLKLL